MNNKLNEGVGKKIVEALKKQSEGELLDAPEEKPVAAFDGLIPNLDDTLTTEIETEETVGTDSVGFDSIRTNDSDFFSVEKDDVDMETLIMSNSSQQESINNSFSDINLSGFVDEEPIAPKYSQEIVDVDMPSNIIILKKLISQLPSGVTRHTGAQIIKQTMEALGISMRSVLKEAQEVQDGLKDSAKECQATILEYKKQISILEKQSQNYQKQYGALNDLISLFIQTTK